MEANRLTPPHTPWYDIAKARETCLGNLLRSQRLTPGQHREERALLCTALSARLKDAADGLCANRNQGSEERGYMQEMAKGNVRIVAQVLHGYHQDRGLTWSRLVGPLSTRRFKRTVETLLATIADDPSAAVMLLQVTANELAA